MAEAYLKSLQLKDIKVISSGVIANANHTLNERVLPHTIALLKKHGIDNYSKTHSDQLTQARVESGDITIFMNQIVVDECEKLVTLPGDIVIWDIDDTGEGQRIVQPGGDDYQYDEEIYEEIVHNIDQFVHEKNLV